MLFNVCEIPVLRSELFPQLPTQHCFQSIHVPRFGSWMRKMSWLCVFVLPLSSRQVHKLGGRDPGPRNSPMARQYPRWQAGRRAHQQHGPVSYSGTPERCFSPRGQVRLHSGDAALLPHVSQNKSSLKSRSHSKKRERGRGSLSVYQGSQWARSRIWSEDTC